MDGQPKSTLSSGIDQFQSLLSRGWNSVVGLAQPWTLYQIAILLVLAGAASLIGRSAKRRLDDWIRSKNLSRPNLRLYALASRQLSALAFVVLAGIAVMLMRSATWPSRSYFIATAAQLGAVWVIVQFTSGLIRNRLIGRTIALVAWLWVAIDILGLAPQVYAVMDSLALQFGQVRLSLLSVSKAAIVMALLIWAASAVSNLTDKRINQVDDISPTMRVLVGKLLRVSLFMIAIVVGLQTIGFDLTAFTVFSGAIGLGLGFGLQKVVSNLISGVIILVDKSIKPGDVISLGETFGWISSLGARYVSVVTRDGREYLIPNEDLITNRVVNWSYSDQLVRLEIPFKVSYDSDPHLIRKIAVEAALKPKRVQKTPEPVCHLAAFGDSSIDFVLRFWIVDPSSGVVNIKGEVLLAVWDAFKENNIVIPFPQRDLHVRGPIQFSRPPPQTPGTQESGSDATGNRTES
ncbi:MAG: mechanosensitive ion channel [Alphaproteobacteria bacterium]|nr:mechanosensitive ion channel [Alphaproteobacteria bacterium]